ncbi:MAG: SsrA-binding protein SmpB, partial [Bacilli bacterium]|nr:SsrA-binding protein SmpB [Bacilli bacterium]
MEIINRQASHNYFITDTYEAGIVLTGTEIKSIRNGKCNIKDSYAIIKNYEAYLLNAHISAYEQGNIFNHNETRTRKLLLHKKEILKLKDKVELEGYTLIP